MVGASEFVNAFERNCPGVRMTREEREELNRLFREAQNDARDNYKDNRTEAQVKAEILQKCVEIAERAALETSDGDGEIYIARKIADQIRALKD